MSNDNSDLSKDLRIKLLDTALEWTKQITALSTGSLVLSGTFIKDIFSNSSSNNGIILFAWILLILSVLFGILYIGSLCSMISNAADTKDINNIDLYKKTGVFLALFHAGTFIVGLGAFVLFIFLNFDKLKKDPNKDEEAIINYKKTALVKKQNQSGKDPFDSTKSSGGSAKETNH